MLPPEIKQICHSQLKATLECQVLSRGNDKALLSQEGWLPKHCGRRGWLFPDPFPSRSPVLLRSHCPHSVSLAHESLCALTPTLSHGASLPAETPVTCLMPENPDGSGQDSLTETRSSRWSLGCEHIWGVPMTSIASECPPCGWESWGP